MLDQAARGLSSQVLNISKDRVSTSSCHSLSMLVIAKEETASRTIRETFCT